VSGDGFKTKFYDISYRDVTEKRWTLYRGDKKWRWYTLTLQSK